MAEAPYFALVPCEHVKGAHLAHGVDELGRPLRLVPRVVRHHLPRRVVADERPVRVEEHLPGEHVPVILVVEVDRRALVLVHRRRIAGVRRALPLQPGAVLGVHGVADVGVYPLREGAAVSAADGVRAGERDELLLREPLGGEELRETVELRERRGQALGGVGRGRREPVPAAGRDAVVDRPGAQDVARVARREGQDVGARHCPRARALELPLGFLDHLQPAEAAVRRRRLLRVRVGGAPVKENRTIATLARTRSCISI